MNRDSLSPRESFARGRFGRCIFRAGMSKVTKLVKFVTPRFDPPLGVSPRNFSEL